MVQYNIYNITSEVVQTAIKMQKSNKAAGLVEIQAELTEIWWTHCSNVAHRSL